MQHALFFFVKSRAIQVLLWKRRYGDNRYKCATGDAEKGATLEGLADGYRGTE